MIKLPINSLCTGCSACYNACPVGAIAYEYNQEGFIRPVINNEVCIECGKCKKVCQLECTDYPTKDETIGYRYSGSEEVVFKSSSGGAFSFLSNIVLSKGGIVYGVRFNSSIFAVEHGNTDTFPLADFRKSKYAESNVGKSFSEVKRFLQNGRYVLFSGTPCQIKGLLLFLGKRYENLLTVDFVCHGTPSCVHLSDYLHYLQKKYKKNILSVDFRPKDLGWRSFFLKILFEDYSSLLIPYRHSYYYWAFNKNLFLKESCYSCNLNNHSCADITLGDFWGVSLYMPSIDNNKGISIVLANTEKAKNMLNEIKDSNFYPIPLAAYNYIYKDSTHKYNQLQRRIFNKYMIRYGYMKSVSLFYWRQMFRERMKDFLMKKNGCIWSYPDKE